MNGQQNATLAQAAFIPLGFVFWNSHPNQGAGESGNRSPYTCAGQGCHDRTGCNEGPHPGDCKRADSGEPAQRAADDCAGRSTCGRTLGSFCAFLVCKVFRPDVFREQDRNVGVAEASGFQSIHRTLHSLVSRINSEDRGIFSSH